MLELFAIVTFLGYIYYLRNYAGLRSKSVKEKSVANMDTETALQEDMSEPPTTSAKVSKPFFDKKLGTGAVMVLLTSVLMILVIRRAESVHIPYLVAVLCAMAVGFVEPHKGWALAIMQCLLVLGGYFLFTTIPDFARSSDLENFSLYGSVLLTFVAGFLGGFMKRAFSIG
jgi:hypothetical protein